MYQVLLTYNLEITRDRKVSCFEFGIRVCKEIKGFFTNQTLTQLSIHGFVFAVWNQMRGYECASVDRPIIDKMYLLILVNLHVMNTTPR